MGFDITMVSPLHADGTPRRGAEVIARAERDKETTYSDLVDSTVLRLVMLVCETGGCWNKETVDSSDESAFVIRSIAMCVCVYVCMLVFLHVCTYVCMYVCMLQECSKSWEIFV